MPFVSQEYLHIYYEVEGNGPPLVLLHGGFGSLQDWRDYGYVTELKQTHQLILIDCLGHGKSDKPHDATKYALKSRASHVTAVLDDQSINRAHLLGFSMGGWIGFGVARYSPTRLRSLIVLDHHPYPTDLTSLQEAAKSLRDWVPTLPDAKDSHKTRMMQNDPEAMVACHAARHQADISEVLSMMDVPCLIVAAGAGDNLERAKRSAEAIENSTFVSLDGLNHLDMLFQSHQVLPHVVDFLANMRQS